MSVAYCSLSDVQAQIPLLTISVSSVPNSTQVAAFITLCAGRLDSALKGRGLSVPVATPTEFVEDLQLHNAIGAAALAWMQAFPSDMGPSSGGSLGVVLWRTFNDRLKDINSGVNIPVGVAVAEADLSPRSYFTDTGSIGDPDGQATDAWGNTVYSNPTLRRDRVY